MPIFEYRCTACGGVEEFLAGVQATDDQIRCSACGSQRMHRLLSTINIGRAMGSVAACGADAGVGGACCGGHCAGHV